MVHPNRHAIDEREIRVALVLYGGVSLAIYENGVTRCFSDLVRGLGVFRPLLDLLQSRATVDVIAGTSAGGINGLMLAACLESGQDFAETAEMWRRLGDLGSLLRGVGADKSDSLIDGRTYYQGHLIEAMQRFCRPLPNWESPGEMDVYITGTDVAGHCKEYVDGLGQTIEDKEHRTVFHLQHRPGRKRLGMPDERVRDSQFQGIVLGSIARITSCFPVAFPPFHVRDLPDAVRSDVAKALRATSGIDEAGDAVYVDGGVLDNKPFGPALKAIFHRMPGGPVDRRLFYCEPDPVRFSNTSDEKGYTPLAIGLSALSSIPANESIGGDLDELKRHNARIDWLLSVKKDVLDQETWGDRNTPGYRQTRIDALARGLTIDGDSAPSAGDIPADSGRKVLFESVRDNLRGRKLAELDRLDVHYHLRLAYHYLYKYYTVVEQGDDASAVPLDLVADAMRKVGRVIKALKLVRDYQARLRELVVPRVMAGTPGAASVLDALHRFLDAEAKHWGPLVRELEGVGIAADGDASGFLPSGGLSRTSGALREALSDLAGSGESNLSARKPPAATILDRLAAALHEIVSGVPEDVQDKTKKGGADGKGSSSVFGEFEHLDSHLYPLEFASGTYELDRVEFVRIGPGDAQVGLSAGDPNAKVAGDALAHFAAMLRRDWRSSDILYGRLDGICQILRSLLDREALRRLLRRDARNPISFAVADLSRKGALDRCPPDALRNIELTWTKLKQVWSSCADRLARHVGAEADEIWLLEIEQSAEEFRAAWIRAGQEQAVAEDLATVYEDMHVQDIAFGMGTGPDGVTEASSPGLVECKVRAATARDMREIPAGEWSARFGGLALGAEAIAGPNGRVPGVRLGEYATQAYLLLYEMIEGSAGAKGARVMDSTWTKAMFWTIPRVLHAMLGLVRRDRATATMLLWSLLFAGLGGGAVWWMLHDPQLPCSAQWKTPVACLLAVLIGAGGLYGIREEQRQQAANQRS